MTAELHPALEKEGSKLMLTTIEGLGLGFVGLDHLLVGNIGSFILKLATLGGCGVWWAVDYYRVMSSALSETSKGVLGFHRWSDGDLKTSKTAAVVSLVVLAVVLIVVLVLLLAHLTRR